MPRQRLRSRSWSLSRVLGSILVVALALALAYAGLVVALLAFGVSAADVDAITGYQSVYDALSAISAGDVSGGVRLIAGIAGIAAFALFGVLAWGALPRPYLARSDTRISDGERGYVNVSARALERAVEGAALGVPAVTDARARTDDERVTVDVTAVGAADVPATLASVRARARESLRAHELPELPVDCTLTALERKNRRELA